MQVIEEMRGAIAKGLLVRLTLSPEGGASIRVSAREIPGNTALDSVGMLVGSFDRPARDTSGGAGIPDFQKEYGNSTTWDDFVFWMRNGLATLGYDVEWLQYDVSDEAVTHTGIGSSPDGSQRVYNEIVSIKITG